MAKIEKAGGIVLDFYTQKVALIYRKTQNDYSFPKGHHEEGEELFETAMREVEEETGRVAYCIWRKPVATVSYQNAEGECNVDYFLMQDIAASTLEVASELKHELVWLNPDEVHNKLSYPNLQAMWDKVRVFADDFFADAKKKSQ